MSVEYDLKRLQHLRNYREIAEKVKKIVSRHDPEAEVYVFGSILEGRVTGLSDIDLLVVSKRTEAEYKLKIDVDGSIDGPLEIHFATPDQYNRWYSRFIGKKIKI